MVRRFLTTREAKSPKRPQKKPKKISLFPFSFSAVCVILYEYHYDKYGFQSAAQPVFPQKVDMAADAVISCDIAKGFPERRVLACLEHISQRSSTERRSTVSAREWQTVTAARYWLAAEQRVENA